MGQKTNPTGLRLGIIQDWNAKWLLNKNAPNNLVEDYKLRKYLQTRLKNGGLSSIIIGRTSNRVNVTIYTSRPGIVIGKGGEQIELLGLELKKLCKDDIHVNVKEIKRPEIDASLVAANIIHQIESRASYKRTTKMAIASAMRMGALGIKISCSGRLGGAEMARSETYKEGRIPTHTFRANIDYHQGTAYTIYGTLGVKVWIFKGEQRLWLPNVNTKQDNITSNKGGSQKFNNKKKK